MGATRYGAKQNSTPPINAASRRPVSSYTSKYAPSALNGNVSKNTTLYAICGPTPSQDSGVEIKLRPIRFSEKLRMPGAGKNAGAFHQVVVNGTAFVFHQRIQVLSAGSPASCG